MSRAGEWPPRLAQEARLRQLDELLAREPDAIEPAVERAALLRALGRRAESREAFLDVLKRAPTHFGALNDFGALLSSDGFLAAASRVYSETITHHPANPMGHINLANLLVRSGDWAKACEHYAAALRIDPDHPQAHQGMGAALAGMGDRAGARLHFQRGFGGHAISILPYRGTSAPVPLLLLVSSSGGNIPTAAFLDDRIFLTSVIVADFLDPAAELPPHRLVFNSIGDADLCRPALEAAERLVRRSDAPVINRPSAVLATGRAANSRRLAGLTGVVAPRMVAVPRAELAGPEGAALLSGRGFAYPLLLRSPGFHTGHHFVRVDTAADLPAAAASLPGDELLAIEYLDARGPDGSARKFRVMIIDGQIFPLHLAISREWKVHYFTADMAERPDHRSQDEAFLADMAAVLGRKAVAALERIRDALDLDYGGVDFGLSPAGDVLLFEANATMVVNPPDADERWAYRHPAVTRILDAVGAMIGGRAGARLPA